ncbi:MAG: hypothetical protein GXY06_01380 [Clostridiaceae bacterium]|nr:hypothetical protein [Clostridiaceae bacterium]
MNDRLRRICVRGFRASFGRFLGLAMIIVVLISFCGCKYLFDNYRSGSSAQRASEASPSGITDSTSASDSDLPANGDAVDSTSLSSEETSASDTSDATSTESETVETTVNRLPANPSSMYSSYAFMKSFDPETGVAAFDYFDMLRGQDAIDFLVSNKGYTPEAAAEEVNEYADGEFVLKNVNPQLRYADMSVVSISMMYDAAGVISTDANTFSLNYADFLLLFQSHPGDVVDGIFFYYVTVANGQITAVDQVYWP